MDSLGRNSLQQLKQQEAAEEAIGACEKHNFRLLRQLRGRYRGSCPCHVSLRQEPLQPQIGCADCLCVSIVNAGKCGAGRLAATAQSRSVIFQHL